MTIASTYSYSQRSIFDLTTLLGAIRFIIVNFILALIFLFLTVEELEWATFSYKEKITDNAVDNSSWNIQTLF
tara:strand:+ start:566 stop:784 length:219 start_codon:yes stop_codon:yes gene_type:complete